MMGKLDRTEAPAGDSRRGRTLRVLLRVVLPFLVVAAGVASAVVLIKNRPQPPKTPPKPTAALVDDVREVALRSQSVVVSAMGTVIPSREIVVRSRVGGEIMFVSDRFIDGGLVSQGEEILRIDPIDYELAVAAAESQLAQAVYERDIESGRQQVARREWELLDAGESASEQERDLALRRPHLTRVQASHRAAEAQLKRARLDLERTVIRAPFNALIASRGTELGAQVSVQDHLARLVDVDAYWVRVSLPTDRLPWVAVPREPGDEGSRVRIYTSADEEASWDGIVIRLLGDLEERGRMARLLVRVDDPMSLTRERRLPLLLGSYVRVEIQGRRLDNVAEIPRPALRDNANVWVILPDDMGNDTLAVRPVDVAWRGPETVLIREGLSTGDRLVVSDIPAPVPGMLLVVANGGGPSGPGTTDEE